MNKKNLFLIAFQFLFLHSFYAQNFNEREKKIIHNQHHSIVTVQKEAGLKILLSPSDDISLEDPLLERLIHILYKMVLKEDGVGIAAPQVGVNKNVFLIQRFDKSGHPFEEFVNPKILWTSDLYQKGPEGCLSIPDFRSDIWRHYAVQVEFYRLNGKKVVEIIEGFTAVIFQHEYDHLIGRLITDELHTKNNESIEQTILDLGKKKK